MFQSLRSAGGENEPEAAQPLGQTHPISLARLAGLLEATGFSDPVPVFRALDYEGFVLQRLP
jgi:hypothetical protein